MSQFGDDARVRLERVNDEMLVLDVEHNVVHRLSGQARDEMERVAGTDAWVSRRALLAVVATCVGATTLALPSAAAAASGVVSGAGATGGTGDTGAAVPGAPINLTATEMDSAVELNWAAGSGVTPTSYMVSYTPTYGSGTTNVTVTAPTTTLDVTGLTNNVSYTFSVYAIAAGVNSSTTSVTAIPGAMATLSTVSPLTEVMSRSSAVTVAAQSQSGSTTYYSLDGGAETSFSPWATVTGLTATNHTVVVTRRKNSDSSVMARATVSLTKRDVTVTPANAFVLRNPDSPYRIEQVYVTLRGGVGGAGGNATSGGTTMTGFSGMFQSKFIATAMPIDRGDTLTFAAGSGGTSGTSSVDGRVSASGGGTAGRNAFDGYDGGGGGDVGSSATCAGGGGGGGAATVVRHYDKSAGTTTDWAAPGYGGGGGAIIYSTVKAKGSTTYTTSLFTVLNPPATTGGAGAGGIGIAAGNGGGGGGAVGGVGGVAPVGPANDVYWGNGGSRGSFSPPALVFNSSSHSSATAGTDGYAQVTYYEITSVTQS